MSDPVARRIDNALWGAFIGDALAMPVHWFYSQENIRKQFPGGLDRYYPAPHPHPDAFMLGMTYQPDVEKARSLGRPCDILHQNSASIAPATVSSAFPWITGRASMATW